MEQKQIEIDAARVARQAFQERQSGEDLDEALLRVCKRLYGEQGFVAFSVLRDGLKAIAEHSKSDAETALRQMAEGKAPVRVQAVVNESVTTHQVSSQSLDALPPEVRAEVQKAISSGKSSNIVITGSVMPGGEKTVLPSYSDPKEIGSYRCSYCGYRSQSDWVRCPSCNKEKKLSFWRRLFGGS